MYSHNSCVQSFPAETVDAAADVENSVSNVAWVAFTASLFSTNTVGSEADVENSDNVVAWVVSNAAASSVGIEGKLVVDTTSSAEIVVPLGARVANPEVVTETNGILLVSSCTATVDVNISSELVVVSLIVDVADVDVIAADFSTSTVGNSVPAVGSTVSIIVGRYVASSPSVTVGASLMNTVGGDEETN